jgi:Baseplate J-like protein
VIGGQYFCKSEQRRAQVLAQAHPSLNGIDFLEVDPADERTLHIHFLFDIPGTANPVPPAPAPALTKDNVVIEGGVRITGITATGVTASTNVLTVTASAAGDFSTYTLRLVTGASNLDPPPGFDPRLSSVDFSFKVNCPSDFDCRQTSICPAPPTSAPNINYLAKDYASFRQLIFDRMAITAPGWRERNPADIGVALVELLAYAGDQLSYYQDAVATEAYLGTARRRTSVRRHARLLDYAMHDGCNARSFVFLQVDPGPSLLVPQGTQLITLGNAPRGRLPQNRVQDLLNQGSLVFRTLAATTIHAELNSIDFYTWSDSQCCLPQGATEATLADPSSGGLPLSVGDLLLFEEVLGVATGQAADADYTHRHVVRLTRATRGKDPLTNQSVVEIGWDPADALPFPLCLSVVLSDTTGSHAFPNVSVARGNLVLAEHAFLQPAEMLPDVGGNGPYRPRLHYRGLSVAVDYDDAAARLKPAAGLLIQDPRQALPVVTLSGNGTWSARRDLFESDRSALDFVVEIEEDGAASLRFGDGILGAKPVSGLQASYCAGNGSAGNVGAESIAYAVVAAGAPLPGLSNVRNPLPAQGGVDPETLDTVRFFAPEAFRTQERAVTAADYARIAERHPQVQRAQAALRWTGSWCTMFVTVERRGGQPVDAAFRTEIRNFLEQFRLAGYDLEIEPPLLVSLDIAFTVCVGAGYFRSAVKSALLEAFSNRILPDGRRGFFYPGNFTFGQPIYISQIVSTAMQIPGIKWIDTNDVPPAPNRFTRLGQLPRGEAAAGRIAMAPAEIARLDNDPSRPENGKITFLLEGGL